jgi:hypothetical protein
MEKAYPYLGEFLLDDDTSVVVDLEEHGWAEPSRLARVRRISLVPKPDAPPTMGGGPWPVVIVHVPPRARPVFKSRAFGRIAMGSGEGGIVFRCYALGYATQKRQTLTWVLPTGDIEVGDDPELADMILRGA